MPRGSPELASYLAEPVTYLELLDVGVGFVDLVNRGIGPREAWRRAVRHIAEKRHHEVRTAAGRIGTSPGPSGPVLEPGGCRGCGDDATRDIALNGRSGLYCDRCADQLEDNRTEDGWVTVA